MRSILRFVLRLLRLVLTVGLAMAVVAATAVVIAPRVAELVSAHVSDHAHVSLDPLSERSYIYDRYGNKLATLVADQNRVQVPLKQISTEMVHTVLAVEDEHFYQHHGVNVKSIGRAFSANISSGGVSQGGSTITQQLIKNSIVGNKQDLSRKLREAFLAVQLEKQMTKDQILGRYLNTVYFGNGAYGVQAAAEVYFTVDASKLNWAQAALLTALIRGPVDYDPFKHKALAKARRAIVFDVLARQKLIPKAALPLLNGVALPLFPNQPKKPDDYFVEEVKQQLLSDTRLGSTPTARYNAVFGGGLRVYTTFDPYLQVAALQARDATLPGGKGDGTFDVPPDPATGKPRYGTATLVGVEPSTGAVRMLVGGPGYARAQQYDFASVDLATQGYGHQPGSSFKTFVLTEAMEEGLSPDDTINGSGPCRIPGYPLDNLPNNFAGEGGSVASLTTQTLRSSNCAYLRLGQVVGLGRIATLANQMGITTHLPDNISSMPIGSVEVHPLDMAAAYSVLANDGIRNPAYYIDRVTDSQGRILFQHQATPIRVVSSESARLVTQVLVKNVESGTGTRARLTNGQDAAGKTGTTNGPTDVWFVGYTPQLAVSVWMGGATGSYPLGLGGSATGGRYPAATWGYLMNNWLARQPVVPFLAPDPRRGGKYLCQPIECSGGGSTRPRRPRPNGTVPGLVTVPSRTPVTAPPVTAPPVTNDGNVTPASTAGRSRRPR